MAFVKRYNAIVVGTGSNASIASGGNLASATTYVSHGVPVCGAKMVVFRITATNSSQLQSAQVNFGEGANRNYGQGATAPDFFAASGVGCTNAGNVGTDPTKQGGLAYSAYANSGKFHHKFAQIQFLTNASTAFNGYVINAEVHYDTDADLCAAECGQQNYVMPTN